jgi:hypothetical protein
MIQRPVEAEKFDNRMFASWRLGYRPEVSLTTVSRTVDHGGHSRYRSKRNQYSFLLFLFYMGPEATGWGSLTLRPSPFSTLRFTCQSLLESPLMDNPQLKNYQYARY